MNIESIWMIIVGVSAPIAGIVAFYIQLKNVERETLVNEKISLEISNLKEEKRKLESQIKIPTDKEIEKYSQSSRVRIARVSDNTSKGISLIRKIISIEWGSLLIAIFVVGFIGYFFYDVYRIGLWLINIF